MSRTTLTHRELLDLPTSVPLWPTAGQAHGLSKWSTYELHKRGSLPFPVLKLGRQLRVTRADLLRSLGVDPNEEVRSAG